MAEHTSSIARMWLDDEDILHYVATGGASTSATVEEGFGIVQELTGGRRVPILFDARNWPKGDPASWQRFIERIESICVAAAVIVTPASKDAMGAFPPIVDHLLIPFRLFEEEEAALAFLRGHPSS